MAGCTFNTKPTYNDKEQAKAEAAVTQFHKWYNDRNFDGIYPRLDDKFGAPRTKEEFIVAATHMMDKWGKLQTTRLNEAQVFPSSPIQVTMLYNSTFENGNAQEWFTRRSMETTCAFTNTDNARLGRMINCNAAERIKNWCGAVSRVEVAESQVSRHTIRC